MSLVISYSHTLVLHAKQFKHGILVQINHVMFSHSVL